MRNLLALIGLAALLYLGYQTRDRIPGPWNHASSAAARDEVSPQALASAERKLKRMQQSGDTIHLTSGEFSSYLRYRFQDQVASQLDAPSVHFSGDTLTLNGRFPADRLPDTQELRAVRSFIPDTAEVKLQGGLRMLSPGRAALRLESASFAKVPVPRSVYADALKKMGRRDEPGLGADEYPFRLPPGVASARVEGGELVLSPR